jgi:hypothetical protein
MCGTSGQGRVEPTFRFQCGGPRPADLTNPMLPGLAANPRALVVPQTCVAISDPVVSCRWRYRPSLPTARPRATDPVRRTAHEYSNVTGRERPPETATDLVTCPQRPRTTSPPRVRIKRVTSGRGEGLAREGRPTVSHGPDFDAYQMA